MEYTIGKLATISGVTVRTLHYYDAIGLLCPRRCANGYRLYGPQEVDTLQQIMFYREMGFELEKIKEMLASPQYDRGKALRGQLQVLQRQRLRTEHLIRNIKKTIAAMKGEDTMNDNEKFDGFCFEEYKQNKLAENEAAYGDELREKYGDTAVDGSIFRVKGMNEETWLHAEELRKAVNPLLVAAMHTGNVAGPEAAELCRVHREWVAMFWAPGSCTDAAYASLGDMYAGDERFAHYYEAAAGEGAAQFLCSAIHAQTGC